MKERLDKYLVKNNFVESREKAISLIKLGLVKVNGKVVKKPSFKVDEKDFIKLEKKFPYVSRAGLKLERALKLFNISVENKICLDLGASTGGFTDCLLKHNAKKVYAVDSGTGQLHKSLRNNPKVISMEKTNARYLTKAQIPEDIDFLSCDVSFISVLKILPNLKNLLKEDFEGVVLVKPQFELTKEKLKDGIVKEKKYHIQALEKVICGLFEAGFGSIKLDFSKPFGSDGNIEFLLHINFSKNFIKGDTIKSVVEKAHMAHKEEKNGSSRLP